MTAIFAPIRTIEDQLSARTRSGSWIRTRNSAKLSRGTGANPRTTNMTDVNWIGRVAAALKRLDKEFKENELAYLALTSKAEKQIIDRLAFSLHRDYGGDDDVSIAREFTDPRKIQRVDLAIVHDKTPLVLLEAKAMQSYHVNLPNFNYLEKLEQDKKKLREYAPATPPEGLGKAVLLLTTHTSTPPDKKWDGIVKAAGRIRNHRPECIDELKAKLNKLLPSRFFPISGCGDIPGGCAFDMKVTIHFRLFGPY